MSPPKSATCNVRVTHPIRSFCKEQRRSGMASLASTNFVRSPPSCSWSTIRLALTSLIALLTPIASWALNPNLHLSQYGHTAWRVRDGLVPSGIRQIAQTADGYIWLATSKGLARFDGVRFVPWIPPGDEQLPSPVVTDLLASRDGSLWIGTRAGLSHWVNRHLINFASSGRVLAIAEDRNGAIWFTSLNRPGTTGGHLCRIVGTGLRCYEGADGVPAAPGTLLADSAGNLWIGTASEIVRWTPDSHDVYTTDGLRSNEDQSGVNTLALNSDGALWVGMSFSGTGARLQLLTHGMWKPFTAPSFDNTSQISTVMVDSQGTLWVGVYSQGMYRIRDGKVEHFGGGDGLSADRIITCLEDREGNLWVVTVDGLDLFRDVHVASYVPNQGLKVGEVDGVLAGRDGTVWIGSDSALEALHGDEQTVIRGGKIQSGAQVTALFEDHAGQLWIGVDQTLSVYKNGVFEEVRKGQDAQIGWVIQITEDSDNDIWAAAFLKGGTSELLHIRGHQVVEEFPTSQIPAGWLAPDPAGGLWLGLLHGDLAKMQHGRVQTFKFDHDANSHLNQVAVGPDGAVLGATTFGLIGMKDGKHQVLTMLNGLPCDTISKFLTDAKSDLWLDTPCGIVKIAAAEVRKWWSQSGTVLNVSTFGVLDGARPATPWTFPDVGITPDGRLWFGAGNVLQVIDPAHLSTNTIPPPVHVEEVIADRRVYAPQEGLQIPPLSRDLQIDYTALSFSIPQKVLFRYRLEGRDAGWQEPGTRRQAFYTDLRPGKYRFRVIACNNDGVWNEEGASLNFVVLPAWYQTTWFRVLCVVFALLAVWVIFRLRVRKIAKAMNARFDERLAERTRIARDLHDTFLQTIQGSKLVADDALESSTDPARMRRAVEQLSIWLGRATQEGRAALNSLRMTTLERNDLAGAFRRAVDECQLQNSMQTSFSVAGEPQEMHPIVRDEVYRIGYEAIRNACVHSRGSQLWVELTYSADLTVRVRDNGVGMEAEIAERGMEGHFGLRGMRERAARIAAKLAIESNDDAGTSVELIVPGGIIYSGASSGRPSLRKRARALLKALGLSDAEES